MDTKASKSWEQHIGGILVGLLVVMVLANVGWYVYRYGGQHYYMRVGASDGTFPIAIPVGLTESGYMYHGVARNATGKRVHVRFQTNADRPGPYHAGQIVRVTVNQHYGVTNFKPVTAQQVPENVHLK